MTSTKKGRNMIKPSGAHNPATIRERGLREVASTVALDGYTKFMVVRNPIERFVSAYYDKMARIFDEHYDWLLESRQTVLQFVNVPFTSKSQTFSFVNFTNFVLHSKTPKSGYDLKEDVHWKTYAYKYMPCSIKCVFLNSLIIMMCR